MDGFFVVECKCMPNSRQLIQSTSAHHFACAGAVEGAITLSSGMKHGRVSRRNWLSPTSWLTSQVVDFPMHGFQ